MTDREKLIALMDAAREYADFECDKRDGCSCCPNDSRDEFCLTPDMVDYLIANGVTVQRWIPVTERVPDVGADILVCHKNGFVATNAWLGTHWWFKDDKNTITHWMPLPEPPMRKGENG